jgi:acyl-CoA oxidase
MGGHGYSIFSGVSEIFATFVPANTYEGDNYVLSQQVARFLLKQLQNVVQGKKITSGSADYLAHLAEGTSDTFEFASHEQILDPQVQLKLFGTRAARLVADLGQQLQAGREWSDLNIECWTLSFAHTEYLILKQLIQKVESLKSSENAALAPAFKSITDLVSIYKMDIIMKGVTNIVYENE